jgi:hypothetical protein
VFEKKHVETKKNTVALSKEMGELTQIHWCMIIFPIAMAIHRGYIMVYAMFKQTQSWNQVEATTRVGPNWL